jgi:molybdopterin converting factor subunit 1
MLVTVRLFARLRELAGTGELRQELPSAASTKTAWDALVASHPALAGYERGTSCAVNEEYARWTTTLKDGDEIAFLPPVSGGACSEKS